MYFRPRFFPPARGGVLCAKPGGEPLNKGIFLLVCCGQGVRSQGQGTSLFHPHGSMRPKNAALAGGGFVAR